MTFKRSNSVVAWIEDIVSTSCLVGIVVIAAGSVFGRYALHIGFLWMDKVNQTLLVTMGTFGGARATRSDGHAEFTSFADNRRSRTARIAMRAAINILTITLLVFVSVTSMQFTLGGTMESTVPRIPRMYFYMSIPMGSGFCIYGYLKVVETKILTDAASENEQEETQMGEVIALLVILTFTFIIVGIPIYISLVFIGLLSLAALVSFTATPLTTLVIPQSIFNGIGSLLLLAIPFFMPMGEIMNQGRITEKLTRFAMLLAGRLPVNPGFSSIAASMFPGGITGFAQASISRMGGILIPTMREEGYPIKEAVGTIAVASTCGPIIPPSIIMVVFATAVGCPVGIMFMGGLIPGILVGLILMIILLVRNHIYHFPKHDERLSCSEAVKVILDGITPSGMPAIIVGGTMGDVYTPTEAGAIAVVYSLLVSLFVNRILGLRDIWSPLLATVNSAAPLLLIIACARIFSHGLTALQIPVIVNNLVLSLTSDKYVSLMLVNILLLIMGMFMDKEASAIILVPILAPVAATLSISTIHFGVIMALNLIIGNITPPLGYCLFTGSRVGNITMEEDIKGIISYLITEIVTLLLIAYIPSLVTYTPVMLGYGVVQPHKEAKCRRKYI